MPSAILPHMTVLPVTCCVSARQHQPNPGKWDSEAAHRSGVDPVDWAEEVHLADIDSIVTEDCISHHDVEEGIGDGHLQKIVFPAKDLAGRRPRHADLALAGFRIL